MENKVIIKRAITIILGLCIVFARIIYPTHISITKFTVVLEFLLELVICLLIIIVNKKEIEDIFSKKIENKKTFFENIFIIWAIAFFGGIILELAVQFIYTYFTGASLAEAYDPAGEIGTMFKNTFFLPVLLVQCFVAPVEEELVFRYTFRKIFSKNNFLNIFLYLVLSSWLFGFIHSASLIAPGMITYICTGFVLALTYLKFKDIRLMIGAHIFYNSLLWIISLASMLF